VVRHLPVRRLIIHVEGQPLPCRSPCIFIGNNEYQVSGLALGSRSQLDDGRLSVFVTREQRPIAFVWLALRCVLGLLDEERDLLRLSLADLVIDSRRGRVLVAVDGEVERQPTPLRYRIRPRALTVFAPAPAARVVEDR
jgi:diacylglycerol kinase family enzyme